MQSDWFLRSLQIIPKVRFLMTWFNLLIESKHFFSIKRLLMITANFKKMVTYLSKFSMHCLKMLKIKNVVFVPAESLLSEVLMVSVEWNLCRIVLLMDFIHSNSLK